MENASSLTIGLTIFECNMQFSFLNLLQVCCICLAKYVDDDELRELPCFHVFHVDCIDKWLKINACCPLCKKEVNGESPSAPDSSQQ